MAPTPSLRVYIAGPDVFSPDAVPMARAKKALCAQRGLIGLHPLDNDQLPLGTPGATARAIYAANRAMMLSADAIIANLTPFRGPSADPGTVFEIGLMAGLGRPAFGYTLDPAPYADRVVPDGATIEDFGLHDNLMIDCALQAFIVPPLPPPSAPLAHTMARHCWCFDLCLSALLRQMVESPAS